jgi:hypothetical protein
LLYGHARVRVEGPIQGEKKMHWENFLEIVSKGDNMPIAGLIPIIIFFTWIALKEAFRHDRLIKQGRDDEILDEMYK